VNDKAAWASAAEGDNAFGGPMLEPIANSGHRGLNLVGELDGREDNVPFILEFGEEGGKGGVAAIWGGEGLRSGVSRDNSIGQRDCTSISQR
jgi:hypothetical protein